MQMAVHPILEETLNYYELTGRSPAQIQLIEKYMKEQGLFYYDGYNPDFTETLELDLSSVEPSLAGPKRPQDPRHALCRIPRAPRGRAPVDPGILADRTRKRR